MKKVILNQNVEQLGIVGQVVEVRDGYARNFLLPRGLAQIATPSNVRLVEKQKSKEIEKEKQAKMTAEELVAKISALTLTFEANAGEDDKLFGSVGSAEVQELLAKEGVEVDKKNVLIKTPFRKTGTYQVDVRCYHNVKASVKLTVLRRK